MPKVSKKALTEPHGTSPLGHLSHCKYKTMQDLTSVDRDLESADLRVLGVRLPLPAPAQKPSPPLLTRKEDAGTTQTFGGEIHVYKRPNNSLWCSSYFAGEKVGGGHQFTGKARKSA